MSRALILFLVLAAGSALGQAVTLTEAEVIRRALAQDPQAQGASEAVTVAEAEAQGASLYPNPTLGWVREQLPVRDGERVDEWALEVPIHVSGRRWARKALVRAEVAATRAAAARTRSEAVTRALEAFYDAVATGREVQLTVRWVARLDEAARVVGRREEEGKASGYERLRLEVEAELARSELRQTEARAQIARDELALLLGVDPVGLVLDGALTTPAEDARAADVDEGQGSEVASVARPSLVAMREAEEAAEDARRAAAWAWIPEASVTGGLRVDSTQAARYGYVAGISIALPIFSRGQDVRAEASARQRLAAAERRSSERTVLLAVTRALQRHEAAREELARFEAAMGERMERLERAAESGYREGAHSIGELVDAQRALSDVAHRRLELQIELKRAELALRAARGEFE